MRALVASATPPHVELDVAADPEPRPHHQALVAVKALSLNRGESGASSAPRPAP